MEIATVISQVLTIMIALFQWIWSTKTERALKAKELGERFKQLTIDGDNLYDQVWKELNNSSQTDWNDIPIRQTKE